MALTACEADTAPALVSERDSAGVRIVESAGPKWGQDPAWVVGAEPVLDLAETGQGMEHEFYRVADAKRLPDGRIVVALPTEIRYYSSTGTHLLSVGGEGEGPGEFQRIQSLATLPPDSLVAYDRRRITVLGPSGGLGRTARVAAVAPHQEGFAVLGRGFVITEYRGPFAEGSAVAGLEPGVYRGPMPVLSLSPTGVVQDTLLIAAGYEDALIPVHDGVAIGVAVLGRTAHVATFDGQLYTGDAIDFEYTVRHPDGVTIRIVRGSKDLALRPELVEAELRARYGPDPSPGARDMMRDYPRPDRMPAYRELKIDATGAVWLAEHRGRAVYETSSEPNGWDVFDVEGVWLGQVQTPGRFQVLEIGTDYVLGVRRDELDVEHVQLLPLSR